MISGAHMVIYSTDAEADRAFFRDVLKFPFVDVGHDWLIFSLPPSEIAIHPANENGRHEIFLMCDDVLATIEALHKQVLNQETSNDVLCTPVTDAGWGLLTHLRLPGGGTVGLYQPRHPTPPR